MLPLPEAAPLRLELAALQRGALHGAWRWSLMRLQPHHVNATFSSSAPFYKNKKGERFFVDIRIPDTRYSTAHHRNASP
jgi:hypothetical protein